METSDDQIGGTRILRASIGILTRGGPVTVNAYQNTDPVLLQGMELPAVATYEFENPILENSNYVNNPVSIELFFGENGYEGKDISIGKFPLEDFFTKYSAGKGIIELKIAVSAAQILSIFVVDYMTHVYRSIGFVDISDLEPPKIEPSVTEQNKITYQQMCDLFQNPIPRETGIPRLGKDISQELTISFEEAMYGASREIKAISTESCSTCIGSGASPGKTIVHCTDCQGTGWKREEKETDEGPIWKATTCPTCEGDGVLNPNPCRKCQGNGWVKTTRLIMLRIPAGIDPGSEVYILHRGEPGRYGGIPGHLRITVNVTGHPLLTRMGHYISIHLPVSDKFAREGGHLRVPGIKKGSSFLINLPAGSKNDMTFQVFKNESYILTARIETYRPAFLFMLPTVNQRLKVIKDWLGNMDYELPELSAKLTTEETPAESKLDLIEKPNDEATPAAIGLTQSKSRSAKQAEFYNCRGKLYIEKKDPKRALADYNKAIELDPSYSKTYDNRSLLYVDLKDPGKALSDLNKALELDPNNAEYYFHRGMLYQFQKDIAKALIDYDKSVELDPTNADVYICRSRVNSELNNLDIAITDLNKAQELNPTDVAIYHDRGLIYVSKKDLTGSLADFNKALELDPANIKIREERAQLYIVLNDQANALADCNILVENCHNNAGAYNNRGYVYFLQNNFEAALRDYNKALELNPKLVAAYMYRGRTYSNLSCYQQAIEDFNKSLSFEPGELYLYLWLGQAYQGLGEKKKAIAYYKKVLSESQNPKLCQEAQQHLADLDKQGPDPMQPTPPKPASVNDRNRDKRSRAEAFRKSKGK